MAISIRAGWGAARCYRTGARLKIAGAAVAAYLNGMAPYDEISEAAIAAMVARFYGKARQDPTIGPLFNAAVGDWDEHFKKLGDFWSSVLLTSGRYKGNPLAAHLKQPIEPQFFERWLALWRETAGELFAPELAARWQQKAENIADSLKLALFFRPGGASKP
jgi:hemoglobin